MLDYSEPTTSLVHADAQGQPTTTAYIIAEGVGLQHKSVRKLVEDHREDFEDFGVCRFEIAKPAASENGGGRPQKVAVLNREQAMLLMTYMRNNPIVREFKKHLIKAFAEMERQLATQPAKEDFIAKFGLPRDYTEALEQPLEKQHQIKSLECENDALKGGVGIGIREFIKTYFVAPGEQQIFDYLYRRGYLIDGRLYNSDGTAARAGDGPLTRPDHMHPTYLGRKYFTLALPETGKGNKKRARVIPERALELVEILLRAKSLKVEMTEQGYQALQQHLNPSHLRVVDS